jgi:Spy/CpxP family protein refolding chaperone
VTNIRKLIALGAIAATLTGGAVMAADPAPMMGHQTMGFHHHNRNGELRVLGQLGLSDAQKASIIGLLKDNRAKMATIFQAEIKAREALRQAKPGDANYDSALQSAATQISDSTRERVLLRGQLREAIYNTLTSDQKAKLVTLRTQEEYSRVFGDGHQGMGHWRGRDGGQQGQGQAPGQQDQ